jgi:aspartyl-tRNA(Asn)/glutamyl-tRNA(Gln) amidotransferase subunit A
MTLHTTLHTMGVADLAQALATRSVSSTEITSHLLGRIEAQRALGAFLQVDVEGASAAALAADQRRAAGDTAPLLGIPIAHKDIFVTAAMPTTAGSKMLAGYRSPFDATVVARLGAGEAGHPGAGAISLGKLNCDEFAMGSSNENSAYGLVLNPWDASRVPGGSSGGSAAAVAARLAPGATGTDTGGSIRQPAAFCGIVGIKPTYGRCSRWGTIAFASSLDQAGAFARTVEDTAIMLGSMAGYDPQDSTSIDLPVPDYRAALGRSVKSLRIGIPKEYRVDGMSGEIDALWRKGEAWFRDAGAEIVEISLPHTRYALATYYIVAPAECSSNLARYDGVRYGLRVPGKDLTEQYEATRAQGFGAEVKRRILIGTYVLSAGYFDAYYIKAQKVRALIARDFADAFKSCDLILTPTAPSAAFALGEKTDDPIAMYLNDVFTVPASLAGLPGISVPAGLDSGGLPLGLQLIGRPFDEETVFAGAAALEKAAAFTAVPQIMAA